MGIVSRFVRERIVVMRTWMVCAVLAAPSLFGQRPPSAADPDSYTEAGRRADPWFKKMEKSKIPANERVIRVVARDAAGQPVPRANIRMKALGTDKMETRQALPTGEYVFEKLSRTVDYEFVAEAGGLASPPRKISQYLPNQVMSIDLRIGAPPPKAEPKAAPNKLKQK